MDSRGRRKIDIFSWMVNNNISIGYINELVINGVWTSELELIKQDNLRFFTNTFTELSPIRPWLICNSLKTLSVEDASFQTILFLPQEIKDSIWSYDSYRVAGLDGLSFKFFRSFRSIFE